MRNAFKLPALLCVLFACGCSPKLYEVKGLVRFDDGTFVDGALVEFVSGEATGTYRGKTGEDGSFVLTLAGKPGVPAGDYRVSISKVVVMDGMQDHLRHTPSKNVGKKYRDPATSGLRVSVPADEAIELVVDDAD
ncbi:MAG: carboxypeptidase-like regulatory domain-containing protein [Planctomycetota bacterium]